MMKFRSSRWGLFLLAGLFLCLFPVNVRAQTLEREQRMTCPFCRHQWTDYNYGRVERCPNCKRDKNGNLPSSGSGYSPSTMPIPKTWNDVRNNVGQSLGNSFMQGFQQGLQNNQAAQQEAARRAAEAAAAAERRRQEILQRAAEEARVNWEQQDAANMAAFGDILSSKKKTGGGLSPLLMKQAQQSSGTWNDPNVVDMRDADTLTPKLLGDDRDKMLGEPLQKSNLHPLAGLSDEQLEKKRAALDKSIADIKKLMEQNGKEYAEIAADAEKGLDAAKQARMDAGTTFIFGSAQGLVDRNVIQAERSVKAVKDGAGGVDAIGLALAVTNGTGDKLATAATAAGGLFVKSPLGAVPGVVKTGLDTAWVWSDYLMLKQQYDRREKLGKQYEDALIHLSSEQAAIIAEQNRRKAASAEQ